MPTGRNSCAGLHALPDTCACVSGAAATHRAAPARRRLYCLGAGVLRDCPPPGQGGGRPTVHRTGRAVRTAASLGHRPPTTPWRRTPRRLDGASGRVVPKRHGGGARRSATAPKPAPTPTRRGSGSVYMRSPGPAEPRRRCGAPRPAHRPVRELADYSVHTTADSSDSVPPPACKLPPPRRRPNVQTASRFVSVQIGSDYPIPPGADSRPVGQTGAGDRADPESLQHFQGRGSS